MLWLVGNRSGQSYYSPALDHWSLYMTLDTTARAAQTDSSTRHFPLPLVVPPITQCAQCHNRRAVPHSLPLPFPTMHPLDAASFLSASAGPAEGSFQPRQKEEGLGGAASSPSPSRGTRASGESGVTRCQDCRHPAKAYCAHRGFVCPGQKTTSHVPASQCNERQQTLAAVDVEPIPKRPRRSALPSAAAAAAPTTTSSVDQPIATTVALESFAREVSLDAVFRRVRLGGPPEPEVAYYTTVTIAGHVFRGVLYDVGPNTHSGSTAAASDTDGSGEVGSSLSTAGGSCLDLALGL